LRELQQLSCFGGLVRLQGLAAGGKPLLAAQFRRFVRFARETRQGEGAGADQRGVTFGRDLLVPRAQFGQIGGLAAVADERQALVDTVLKLHREHNRAHDQGEGRSEHSCLVRAEELKETTHAFFGATNWTGKAGPSHARNSTRPWTWNSPPPPAPSLSGGRSPGKPAQPPERRFAAVCSRVNTRPRTRCNRVPVARETPPSKIGRTPGWGASARCRGTGWPAGTRQCSRWRGQR